MSCEVWIAFAEMAPELKPTEVQVMIRLIRLSQEGANEVSTRTLASAIGASRASLIDAVHSLKAQGRISWDEQKGGKPSRFALRFAGLKIGPADAFLVQNLDRPGPEIRPASPAPGPKIRPAVNKVRARTGARLAKAKSSKLASSSLEAEIGEIIEVSAKGFTPEDGPLDTGTIQLVAEIVDASPEPEAAKRVLSKEATKLRRRRDVHGWGLLVYNFRKALERVPRKPPVQEPEPQFTIEQYAESEAIRAQIDAELALLKKEKSMTAGGRR